MLGFDLATWQFKLKSRGSFGTKLVVGGVNSNNSNCRLKCKGRSGDYLGTKSANVVVLGCN